MAATAYLPRLIAVCAAVLLLLVFAVLAWRDMDALAKLQAECNKGFVDDLTSSLQLKTDLVQCAAKLQQARMGNISDKIGCLTNQRADVQYYLYEVFPLPVGSKEPAAEELSGLCAQQEHYDALRDGTRAAGEGLFTYKNSKGQLFLSCKWVQ